MPRGRYFNGIGFVAWEDVWGLWNQMTDRDAALLRRAAAILRHFAPTLMRTHLFEPFYSRFTLSATAPPASPTVTVSKFANATSLRAIYLLISTAADDAPTETELELPRPADSHREYDIFGVAPLQHPVILPS